MGFFFGYDPNGTTALLDLIKTIRLGGNAAIETFTPSSLESFVVFCSLDIESAKHQKWSSSSNCLPVPSAWTATGTRNYYHANIVFVWNPAWMDW